MLVTLYSGGAMIWGHDKLLITHNIMSAHHEDAVVFVDMLILLLWQHLIVMILLT